MSAHEISHLQPMLPVAGALRGAGHQVLVAASESLTGQVRAAGLDTASLSYETPTFARLRDALRESGPDALPVEVWPRPDAAFWARIATRFAGNARGVLPEYLELARDWAPDLVMCDPMEAAGRMVAGAVGVPVVLYRWGADVTAGAFEQRLAELLEPDCRELGLAGLPVPDLVIDPCPAALQLPGVPPGRRVRYIPSNGAGALPEWARTEPRYPRICVTLGTKVPELGLHRLLRWLVAGIAGLPGVEVALSVPAPPPAEYAAIADRVIGVGPAPTGLIVDRCAVVVHHGGGGTGLTAAVHGVPQLVLPQFADQFAWGELVATSGIGLVLDTFEAQRDPERIRDALATLVSGPAHRAAAQRLAAEMRQTPPPASLIPELASLTRRRTPRAGGI